MMRRRKVITGWVDRPDVPVVAMDASQMEAPIGLVAVPQPSVDPDIPTGEGFVRQLKAAPVTWPSWRRIRWAWAVLLHGSV